mgnify:CR=1 FL=1
MRIILSIFFLFLSINVFSQNQGIENKYLVTNNNFGKINSKTTIDDLFSIFGKDNVGVFDVKSCNGEPYSLYYIETEDIEFYIADWSFYGWWEIYSSDKKFRTKDGLGAD